MRTTIIETKFGVNDKAFVLRGNIRGCNYRYKYRITTEWNQYGVRYATRTKVLIKSYKVKFDSDFIEEYSADDVFAN